MQKSKAPLIIFSIVIFILLIIALIFILKGEKSNITISMYNSICNNQKFTFNMEEENQEIDYKISIAQKSTDICIDMYSGDEHTTTLVLDGVAYFIMHNEEEYYIYDSEDIDADILIGGLKNIGDKEYKKGKEKINGTTYYYEEYTGISTFLMFLNPDEDAQIHTRFYFDGDKIAYIKNIVQDGEESQEELLKITLEYDADDSLFEIPKDYAEL